MSERVNFAFVGDLHIHEYQSLGRDDRGFPRRLKDIDKALASIVNDCDKNEVDTIYLSGDVFHHRDTIDTNSIVVFNRFVQRATEKNISISIVAGNHDVNSKTNVIWAQGYPELSLFTEATLMRRKFVDILLVPHAESIDGVEEAYQMHSKDRPILAFVHKGILQASKHFGFNETTSIDMRTFPVKDVYAGHWHNAYKGEGYEFIGTPWATKFDETHEKRFIIFEVSENGISKKYVPVVTPELIECSVEDYKNLYSDKEKYPYVKVKGTEDDLMFLESGHGVILSAIRKNDFCLSSINTSSSGMANEFIHEYVKNLDVSENARKVIISNCNRIMKEV